MCSSDLFQKGSSFEPIQTPIGLARILICYEIIFSREIIRSDIKPEVLINITNDAWFDKFSGPYQHFENARFRAIEFGLPVLRSANTGISAVIGPYGRVLNKIKLVEVLINLLLGKKLMFLLINQVMVKIDYQADRHIYNQFIWMEIHQ